MNNWIYKEIAEVNKMRKKGMLFWRISMISLIIGVVSFVFMILSHCMGW